MEVQGTINSEKDFKYVKLTIEPCVDDGSNQERGLICAPRSKISNQFINIVTL